MREKILTYAKTDDDRLLLSKVIDIALESEKKYCMTFSQFLNGYEITLATYALNNIDINHKFFGGYDEAERKIILCFPEFSKPSEDEIPICVIKVTGRDIKKLSHRDYLGSVLSLGIKREKIGDIIVFDDVSYIICMKDISKYIISQIRKIGNVGVKLELCCLREIDIPQKRHKDTEVVISSLRVDSIVSAMCHISRSKSAEIIKNGNLAVNWQNITDVSFKGNEKDLFSIKGYGRFKIISVNGFTRSERIKVTVRQYL